MGTGCSTGRAGVSLPPNKELPSLKIALVGDPGVGKTSVLLRYLRNQFSPLYVPTRKVAIENVVRKLNVPAHTVVSLTFWDIPGREDMDVHKSYFRNLDAAIVVTDLTNKVTLDMANVWKQTVLNKLTRTVPADGNNNDDNEDVKEIPVDPVSFPVLLLGNKFDVIEEEIYQELANKQVSVSVNEQGEPVLEHKSLDHLASVAEDHKFIGSVCVSAKQTDQSVATAIQSLVRNILEKKNIPRKWRANPAPPKPPKKNKEFIYTKLEKTDMEKVFTMYEYSRLEMFNKEEYDTIVDRADALVKETAVLRHYYLVSLARFKHLCLQGKLADGTEPSLEDCILGMKAGVKEGSTLKVVETEGFYKLDVTFDEEGKEVKQTKPWKKAYKVFHNEYISICKAILKQGPDVCTALEKYDAGFEKMFADHTSIPEPTNQNGSSTLEEDLQHLDIANRIVRNRAKVKHAREEMNNAIQDVESAGRKMTNVDHW